MQSLQSFANHVGSLTTYAVEAGTHRFHTRTFGIAERNTSAYPTKFFISNPSLLTSRWSYPHSALAAGVNNRKSPLGIQFQNIAVRNRFGSQRINDLNHVVAQYEFWSHPERINQGGEKKANRQFEDSLARALINPEAVNSKESDQDKSSTCPSKIASRSKCFIHHPSIAGERK